MSITDLRKELEDIRASAQAGDLDQVAERVAHALRALDGARLLTTSEAAELLGIRSVNTLKLLVRRAGLPYELRGNRMMIPIATVERLQEDADVRGIRASDQAHDAASNLGTHEGLTDRQMRELTETRPGHLPWQPAKEAPEHP